MIIYNRVITEHNQGMSGVKSMYTGRKYHRLEVGSIVECRYFNSVENKFYGDFFTGKVTAIRNDDNNNKIFTVHWIYGISDLKRKEIRRILA
jgi:hypothetical protein